MRASNPIAAHLAQILLRIDHLAELDERHGPNRGRMAEHTAMIWAADELGHANEAFLEEALRLAEDQRQYRRNRQPQGGYR